MTVRSDNLSPADKSIGEALLYLYAQLYFHFKDHKKTER
jgi:hypothetical protein